MSDPATDPRRRALIDKFSSRKDGRLSATDLKKLLVAASAKARGPAMDAAGLDRSLRDLIDEGLVVLTGAAKDGDHPRPKGSYRLTAEGKESVRPGRPQHGDELLAYQESFILLQLFRAEGRKLSRSKLNEKLKSVTASGNLELDPKGSPDTISYHLHALVESGRVAEERERNAHTFALTEGGLAALAGGKQHQAATFTMSGATLNALLEACRAPGPIEDRADGDEPGRGPGRREARPLDPSDVLELVDGLKSGDYSGEGLIPIPALRGLVATRHGAEAASHPVFDRLLRRMRADGEIRLTSIGNLADATQGELDDAIPGANETIFYIDVE